MKDKILQAEGEELSRLLGEVFQAELCLECNLDPNTCGHLPVCGKIPLTPDEAFKWRDWAVAEVGKGRYRMMLTDVITRYLPSEYSLEVELDYLCGLIQPKHYLQAAALCKL